VEEARWTDLDEASAALERVVEIERRMASLAAERTDALVAFQAAFDAAYPPAQAPLRERARRAELACALNVTERTAETLLGEAGSLCRSLPLTLAALRDGRLSYRHARVLIDETATLDAEDRAELERLVLGQAVTLTAAKFRRRVRRLRERLQPESMTERAEAAHVERAVWVDPGRDGMAYVTAHIGSVEAEAIYDRLTQGAEQLRAENHVRTVGQARADLLVDALLGRQGSAGGAGRMAGIRATVIMTVPVMTTLGVGCEPAIVEGVGPIDPQTARELTAEAPSLYRVLVDPHSSAALAASPESYRIPEALRLWLRMRDESCRFPGCAIRTRHSDLDHTHDWALGGRSLESNLAHLSRGHHTLKHAGGWKVSQSPGGVLEWTSYLGRRYRVDPEFGPPG
jgi:hypothetical protein